MAKAPGNAQNFVDSLIPGLSKKTDAGVEKLKAIGAEKGWELLPEGRLQAWDVTYSITQYARQHLDVDEVLSQPPPPPHCRVTFPYQW